MEVCGKHVHEVPESPSARLGKAIPPDLEELVLACLEKDPDQRPQSARLLVEALRECDLAPWTESRAREWWRQRGDTFARRSVQPSARDAHETRVSTTTLTVDIGRRAS
jgi:serine/threonine-protein kinase